MDSDPFWNITASPESAGADRRRRGEKRRPRRLDAVVAFALGGLIAASAILFLVRLVI